MRNEFGDTAVEKANALIPRIFNPNRSINYPGYVLVNGQETFFIQKATIYHQEINTELMRYFNTGAGRTNEELNPHLNVLREINQRRRLDLLPHLRFGTTASSVYGA